VDGPVSQASVDGLVGFQTSGCSSCLASGDTCCSPGRGHTRRCATSLLSVRAEKQFQTVASSTDTMLYIFAPPPPQSPPSKHTQATAADSQEALVQQAQTLATQVEPAAAAAGDTLVSAAQQLQEGAEQQGQELAGRIEEAGHTLGESREIVFQRRLGAMLGLCPELVHRHIILLGR
jgi:hypothetical protein